MADIVAMLAAVAGAAGGAEPDPYFNYTTLLLPGNGTNGAQNNTFLDSSTNNFTITRYGNTTQGTFSPFSQTGWSNYFDGSGDYLDTPSNAALALGTGDFTIEFWVYISSHKNYIELLDARGGTSNSASPVLYTDSGGTLYYFVSNANRITSGSTLSTNSWIHLAITRSGTSTKLFINGTQSGSTYTDSTDYIQTAWRIGSANNGSSTDATNYSLPGYISNFRVVKGTAVYTSAFTPPTEPLTAISGTSLLTCQSNRFIDNSTNNFSITVNGNTSVQAFSPFAPTAEYDPAVNGGSGYFDGTGDYLTLPSSSNLSVGTGDYTIECWFYPTAAQNSGLFQLSTDSSGFTATTTNQIDIQIYNGNIYFGNTAGFSQLVTTFTIGMWQHIAVVRNSGTVNIYVNGVSRLSVSDTYNYTGTYFTVGGFYSTLYTFNGYISGFRLVKGSAVYTSGFTPPISPPTAITNTSLLCNFTNAGITDATAKNDLETVGNAQVSTAQSKFGTGSLEFDGTGDYLRIRHNPEQQFGTGDFTFEAWIYPTAITGITARDIICKGENASGSFEIAVRDSKIRMYTDVVVFTSTSNVTANDWQHIAITRSGTTLRFFLNGTLDTTVTSFSTNFNETADLFFGSYGNGSQNYYTGFLDDVRITKGIARYTSNFTPPTAAFPLL